MAIKPSPSVPKCGRRSVRMLRRFGIGLGCPGLVGVAIAKSAGLEWMADGRRKLPASNLEVPAMTWQHILYLCLVSVSCICALYLRLGGFSRRFRNALENTVECR